MISETIRVRFAPSPTGYLHVGGLRTALYNYLFARQNNGVFILRIEDTDRTRYVEGAVENLIDTLRWAGLEFDEGPKKGGNSGPYIQSERLDIYRKYAEQLVQECKAYYCFCTSERLEKMRDDLEGTGAFAKYDKTCSKLSESDIEKNLADGTSYVIRMKVPENRIIKFHDLIREEVEIASDLTDEQVLIKSDGYPTYHLANVVDDHLMRVTHVIRGEEWLPSVPKHILLYEYFGWEIPILAHLPLLLNADRSKLSKRQGDVAVEDYKTKGYLKEGLLNFVAFLGWNPGDEREIFSLDELVKEFSLERVGKAGAIFNIEKLNWINLQHIHQKSNEDLVPILKDILVNSKYKDLNLSDEYLANVIGAMRVRINYVSGILEKSSYFFEQPQSYDDTVLKKHWKQETPNQLSKLIKEYSLLQNPTKEDYESTLKKTAEQLGIGAGKLIHPTRLSVSGVGEGPGLYDILFILGKEEVTTRIETAINKIKI
ncbi:MAG: glutamate--tRNA ligase [Bacteroidota bacterium]|nr:glutamate--tRNA ligase [Bacteroidota bacterium]